jgi:hypothetical protein
VQLLDVSFVQIQLRDRSGDLGIGEDPKLLAAVDEALDLFQFLQVRYRHLIPFPSLATTRPSGVVAVQRKPRQTPLSERTTATQTYGPTIVTIFFEVNPRLACAGLAEERCGAWPRRRLLLC